MSHRNGFRLPVPRDRLVPRLISATSRRVLGGKLVGFLQQGHLFPVSHLRGLLCGDRLLQLLHLGFQRLLFRVFLRRLVKVAQRGVDVVIGGCG